MNAIFVISNREVRETRKGFRLWETCTSRRGTAISPIFSSVEDLCRWAESNATFFGSTKVTADQWFKALTGMDVSLRVA